MKEAPDHKKAEKGTFSSALVKLNNFVVRQRRRGVAPANIVLLLPRCLQRSGCERDVVGDIANCRQCGRCKVGELARACGQLGIRCHMATGGRLALEIVRSDDVHAVVAVACEKELRSGIVGAFPKRVRAVVNARPHGPCRDTDVDTDAVVDAIKWFLAPGNTKK